MHAVELHPSGQDVDGQRRRSEGGRREGSDARRASDRAHANPSPCSIRARRSSLGVNPSRCSVCIGVSFPRASSGANRKSSTTQGLALAKAPSSFDSPKRPLPSSRRTGSADSANLRPCARRVARWRGGASQSPGGSLRAAVQPQSRRARHQQRRGSRCGARRCAQQAGPAGLCRQPGPRWWPSLRGRARGCQIRLRRRAPQRVSPDRHARQSE